jgi:hypothetical protein
MTITFLDLYNECAGQPWSMYDSDAESMDDLESALRISINKACSYLWNYQPWTFRRKSQNIRTRAGKADYDLPIGLLQRKTLSGVQKYGVKYDGKFLPYLDNFEELEAQEGAPEYFYIDGDKIYLYPTPDDTYTVTINFLSLTYALNEDEEEVYSFTSDTDTLNVPEQYEQLFSNCLISLAMLYAIADETDENYSGYQRQYEDALATLIKYCNTKINDRSFIW